MLRWYHWNETRYPEKKIHIWKKHTRTNNEERYNINAHSHNQTEKTQNSKKNRFYPKNFSISIKNNQILVFKVAFIQVQGIIHTEHLIRIS